MKKKRLSELGSLVKDDERVGLARGYIFSASEEPGWYRIGEIQNQGSCLISMNNSWQTTPPSNVIVAISINASGTLSNVTKLHHNGGLLPASKIRIVSKSSTRKYIELYKRTTGPDALQIQSILIYEIEFYDNYTAGEIPSGYTALEFEL